MAKLKHITNDYFAWASGVYLTEQIPVELLDRADAAEDEVNFHEAWHEAWSEVDEWIGAHMDIYDPDFQHAIEVGHHFNTWEKIEVLARSAFLFVQEKLREADNGEV